MAGGKISLAAQRHAANIVAVALYVTKLKEARAAAKVSGMELAKEKMAAERAALAKGKSEKGGGGGTGGKKKAQGKGKGKGKAAVAGAAGAAVVKRRGRPLLEPGVCGQCRRLTH